ncbi:MAG: hypothetical protein ACE14S_08375 [Candidatus Bathyarchaeia archaeon]
MLLVSTFSVARLLNNSDLADYTAKAQEVFGKAKREIEAIRNVTLPDVPLEVVTRQWAIDTWGKGYADPDIVKIQREERIYKGLFFIPENASLYQANVDWAGYFGAATWGDRIYVVKENFDPWNEPYSEATFVHELTHIWQPSLPFAATFDQEKTEAALTEGDASYMGDVFINRTKQSIATAVAAVAQVPWILLSNAALKELHLDLPPAISSLNYFPYDYGKLYINALYQRGGWATVNKAYDNPPATTEQILHPDKYFSNEPAQQVSVAKLAETDWTKISSNRYGEYFIQVMLDNWLSKADAETAADGWGGDNLTYYERGSDFLFTWSTTWDTSYDACQFFVAFNFMMNNTEAVRDNFCYWHAYGRYISVGWNQASNTVLVACSSIQAAVQQSYFT